MRVSERRVVPAEGLRRALGITVEKPETRHVHADGILGITPESLGITEPPELTVEGHPNYSEYF
jgi:hypothetical protein